MNRIFEADRAEIRIGEDKIIDLGRTEVRLDQSPVLLEERCKGCGHWVEVGYYHSLCYAYSNIKMLGNSADEILVEDV